MDLQKRKRDDVTILSISGELDSAGAVRLEEALRSCLVHNERWLVMDCARLQHMSSEGLRVLLDHIAKLTPPPGQVVCAALRPDVQALFRLSGIFGLLQEYPTVDQAVDSLRNKLIPTKTGPAKVRPTDVSPAGVKVRR
jgi:anti-sigma B factor antagonist